MTLPTAHTVLRATALHYRIGMEPLLGLSKRPELVDARRTAAYIMRTYLRMTLQGIGAELEKHHTSVIHMLKRVPDAQGVASVWQRACERSGM